MFFFVIGEVFVDVVLGEFWVYVQVCYGCFDVFGLVVD